MDEANQLRERAAKLFALALQAREHGFVSANELIKLADESLLQADELERRRSLAPIAEIKNRT